ncbi:nucleoprotein [Yacaaba virus]|uniref:Nucleoprotein n=1 Tax=Yacaaba virus TaxID=1819307 RepID=A0A142J8G1_9VIRU|nr:nucleocapsid [Yacaaba virus]WMC17281.1 nucleoprotein [Yacaaba virus]
MAHSKLKSKDELVFTNLDAGSSSGFDPNKGYAEFLRNHRKALDFPSIRNFFLSAPRAKASLKIRPDEQMRVRFENWSVDVHNNHFPTNRNNVISDSDLTLHRISGYLSRHILSEYENGGTDTRELIERSIVNPIAESNGITWKSGPKIYLSFFPGTEMFLREFDFYPLALGIYRVQKKDMPAQFLKKTLRQRYGDKTADVWMVSHRAQISKALDFVSELPWGRSGLSQVAREFLAEFGIKE